MKKVLSKKTNLEEVKNYYWLKTELIEFCRKEGLSSIGLKEELMKQIEAYISTGMKLSFPKKVAVGKRDSDKDITLLTPVINYKNDAATRDFFIQHIGPHFHFNEYLRKFNLRETTESLKLTYGDLVKGWLNAEENKKKLGKNHQIGKQFEYNQFTRDFFLHEKEKTRQDAIDAWNFIKSKPGPRTYAHYALLKNK